MSMLEGWVTLPGNCVPLLRHSHKMHAHEISSVRRAWYLRLTATLNFRIYHRFHDRQEEIADFSRVFYHMCTHKTVQWIISDLVHGGAKLVHIKHHQATRQERTRNGGASHQASRPRMHPDGLARVPGRRRGECVPTLQGCKARGAQAAKCRSKYAQHACGPGAPGSAPCRLRHPERDRAVGRRREQKHRSSCTHKHADRPVDCAR